MKLCGEGFMIAGSRTDTGDWDWRTFGTGEGFTADMLVTGFLSADRIQAGTITANKLAADVGETLDLSSNESITLKVEKTVDEAVGYRVELYTKQGDVLSDYVPSTTIQARVWHGNTEITHLLPAQRFTWKRSSQDATADSIWNSNHRGMKEISLTKVDVLYSATYTCNISD